MVLMTRGLGTGATFMRGSIDIIAKGIGNASNFYGWAVYYPNYGIYAPAAQWAGSIIRSARRSWSTLDTTALSSNRLCADSLVL